MNGLFNLFIRSVDIDWTRIERNSYLREIPALAGAERIDFARNITFFVGENGTGKSTLLEAIAVAYGFNPEGGTLNYRFSTYDDVSELGTAMRITKGFLRPEGSYTLPGGEFFQYGIQGGRVYRPFGAGHAVWREEPAQAVARREFPCFFSDVFRSRTLYHG